jgi:uncharacterized protein (DUF58 family)
MYISRRFYITLSVVVLVLASGYLWSPMFTVGRVLLLLFVVAVVTDIILLWRTYVNTQRSTLNAFRQLSDRFSNGDENDVRIRVESSYPFPVRVEVMDEIPFIFQRRDICFRAHIEKEEAKTIRYSLRPTHRGVYGFGQIRVFAASPIGLVQRRFTCGEAKDVKVYPSFLMLHQYELLAISNNLTEMGIKRIRRVGHHTDFEQIKDYVAGDDFRTINWKASARRSKLMVNVYQDERSQQIISVIDKGRVMQQAFQGMTLLDYSINASLVLSYVAMYKEDRAGLATFSSDFDTFVPASRRPGHLQVLMEALYAQQTEFGETDYSALVANLNKHVTKRSLIVLYTNFTGQVSLQRQLPYFQQLNQRHRLLVVFFEDVELKEYLATHHSHHNRRRSTEDYYRQVMADRFVYEQRLIVSTLRQHGILSLLTTPDNLSVDVINRYLEMKQRQQI